MSTKQTLKLTLITAGALLLLCLGYLLPPIPSRVKVKPSLISGDVNTAPRVVIELQIKK